MSIIMISNFTMLLSLCFFIHTFNDISYYKTEAFLQPTIKSGLRKSTLAYSFNSRRGSELNDPERRLLNMTCSLRLII